MSDTTVTFENAALSEAVKRAEKVAPKRGEAYDKAFGVVLEIDPSSQWPVMIKTTNLAIYYSEWVSALESSGDKVIWRMSSEVFSQIITKLPIGSGKSVTISEVENKLQIKSGKFKASIGLIKSAFYPEWNQFDPENTAPVSDLGTRLSQVLWACGKGNGSEAIDGVRFNGTTLVSTDKYRLASVPMNAPHLTEEVTIQAQLVASIVPDFGATRIGMIEGQLLIVPNDYVQIRCLMLGGTFPNVERVMNRDYPNKIELQRSEVLEAVSRVATADYRNRMPELNIYFGNEQLALFVEDSSGGDKSIEVLDYPGQADHKIFKVCVTPSAVIDAMTAAPSDKITLHYDTGNKMKLLYFLCADGYESWVVPRTGMRSTPGSEE